MNGICLVIDRLQAGCLGAYGNTWIETPAFDQLAADGFIFDQAMIDTPQLDDLYRGYWQGWHALCPPPQGRPALPGLLRQAGVTTALLTDEPAVQRHPLAAEFDELIAVAPPGQIRPAREGGFRQTHLAECFRRMTDWVQSARQPFLLWCHLAGLGTTWDAPPEFHRLYEEEGDLEPPSTADVPNHRLGPHYDPEETPRLVRRYAAQVSLLDTCLEALLESLRQGNLERDTTLAVTSSRGFPLGEHQRVGPCDEALYGELVRVPLVLRFPDGFAAATRSQALVGPADLWATLLDGWRVAPPPSPTGKSLDSLVREQSEALRDRLCLVGPSGGRAIRTPAWYLRMAEEPELFAKPDDYWEVNNVATRCQDVAESLQRVLAECEQAAVVGQLHALSPLDDILVRGLD